MNQIVFHFGGPKTGSSALQRFLVKNSTSILKHGLSYYDPDGRPEEINSGNGYPLYVALRNHGPDGRAQVIECLERHRTNFSGVTAICSSELFSALTAAELETLTSCAVELGFSFKIAYYVREPFGYCISNYHQLVKRHGETRELGSYLETAQWDHFQTLQRLREVIPASKLLISAYGSRARENIVADFLELIGFSTPSDLQQLPEKVNRSLTSRELAIMLELNRILGPRYSKPLSDEILKNLPVAGEDSSGGIPTSVFETMRERFLPEIERVNNDFLRDAADKISADFPIYQEENSARDLNQSCEGIFMRTLAKLLSGAEGDFAFRMKMSAVSLLSDKSLADSKELPSDFDPAVYLILNPDLVQNNVNPYFHYINYAKKEGRQYKIA